VARTGIREKEVSGFRYLYTSLLNVLYGLMGAMENCPDAVAAVGFVDVLKPRASISRV